MTVHNSKPLVSVIIPTFNRWPLIGDAIRSVLCQSLTDIEIIVVDDGSTDHTADRVRASFPSVRVIVQENSERGAARNRGAMVANGMYLNFLDSDDVLEPWHIAQVHDYLEKRSGPFPPVLSASAVLWRPDSERVRKLGVPRYAKRRPLAEASLLGMVLPLQGLFVSTTAFSQVGGFLEERPAATSEDWVFLMRLAARFPVEQLRNASVRIRDHPGRSVMDPDRTESWGLAAMRLMLDEGVRGEPLDDRSRRLVTAGAHMNCAANFYGAGRMQDARRHLREAARALPAREAIPMLGRRWAQSWLGPTGSRALREGRNAVMAWLEGR